MYKFTFSHSFDKHYWFNYSPVNDALTSDSRGVVEIKSLTRIGSRKNKKRGIGENISKCFQRVWFLKGAEKRTNLSAMREAGGFLLLK